MKITDLNLDIISYILLFLDIKTIYKIQNVSKIFNYYTKQVINKYSYICGYISKEKKSRKASLLINPKIRNLKIFESKSKKELIFFKNLDINLKNSTIHTDFLKKNLLIHSKNNILKINLNI